MTDRLTSGNEYDYSSVSLAKYFRLDMSFWLKFVRDSNLTANNSTMLKYSMALADRFSNLEEFSVVNENDLQKLGIVNQADRVRLIEQARLMIEKVKNNHYNSWKIFCVIRAISNHFCKDAQSVNRVLLGKNSIISFRF